MTSSLDVRQKQRAVIEFLVSEGEPPKQIFERLVNVYGDASLAYSTVKKWVSRIKHEEDDPSLSSLQDRQRSGRPSSAVNPGNNDKVEKLIRDDRRITIDDIAERVGVSHGSAVNIVNELGFAKVCARWVPRQLLDFHKQARFEACSELIECHRSDKIPYSRPPYSPDLAPSDYHLFGPLKEGVRGQHFTSDQEVKHAVRNWLKMQPADFYKAGIVSLVHRWTVGIEKCGDYIEK